MFVEPADLSADTVLGIVRELWDPGVGSCAFFPRGSRAQHWVCAGRRQPRWFVTADEVSADGRLEELLDTYAAARELARRGHHVVVPTLAPDAELSGAVDGVGVVHGAYLVTVAAYLEGESGPGEYADDNQRALVAGALGALHAESPPERARSWSPGPPRRPELLGLLERLDTPWPAGPFGESVRKALRRNASSLRRLYARFDELAARAVEASGGWVLTHGEPHTANVVWRLGGPVLVDWESLRVAPRERDLRTVLRGAEGAEPLTAYAANGGTADLDADMFELFDLEGWLWEIADYAVRFAAPHTGDRADGQAGEDDARLHQAFLEEMAVVTDQRLPAGSRPVTNETAR